MFLLAKQRSYVLFIFLILPFLGCEQLVEIIKPHLPKPQKEACLLQVQRYRNEVYTSFYYDSLGRLSSSVYTDLTDEPDTTRYATYYTYNERGQLVRELEPEVLESGFDKSISYDASGRITRTESVLFYSFYNRQLEEYRYSPDTVVVNTTISRPWGEVVETSEKMYVYAGENLVKVRYADSTGSYAGGSEDTFSYTSMLNKKSEQEKQLAFLSGSPVPSNGVHMMSKHLVSRWVDRGGNITTYSWEVNPQGYVTKQERRGRFSTDVWTYEYSCQVK